MPQGLQTWDANENITLDLTDRLTKVLGTINTGTTNGSQNVGTFSNADFWFTCIPIANTNNVKAIGPSVKYANGLLSWDWSDTNNDPNNASIIYPGLIIYGVY
ncbi:hypothetical protein [Acinetobacter lactucae]|uniref:hypothetical protein n=1 Tax=Acinetobacter lactucae TaxID=1785128 RepID=UPI0007083A61|nr:hypothetical protein [Acinetobacter lactucae]KQE85723.1 hypothetical protein APB94_15580 [Acinetobacter lactucae]